MLKPVLVNIYRKIMWPFLPNGIYCFNYHRIGDEEKCLFDPNVYSCTAANFELHVNFFNKNFTVISVEQLIEKMEKNEIIDKKYAVITFDDGYIDNYSIAFPILKKHQTPAAFYIATDYIDTPHIPWWDEIAWLIRHSKVNAIKLKSWECAIDISTGSILSNIRSVLKAIKLEKDRSMADKIAELELISQCSMPDELRDTPLFINWEQIKEMSRNGMHIGSHTLSHTILSHLSSEEQKKEITQSKERIETFIKKEVTSIAYPVGGKTAFTQTTQNISKEANYKLAFSFIPGVIRSFSQSQRYQLRRLPVDENCTINQLKNMIVRNK